MLSMLSMLMYSEAESTLVMAESTKPMVLPQFKTEYLNMMYYVFKI